MRFNTTSWRFLAATCMLVLTVPRLWQRGMFADGMTYAVVARNMALGIGDFWAPSLSDTIYSRFFEQPPLGMALQAIAFALVGDHFAVERAFSLLMFGANAVLIVAMWRRLLPAQYDWLPILLWLVPSVVTWAVINNMLENTQAVFTSLACYALLRTSDRRPAITVAAWAALAAASVVAATLIKGPVGLFPLTVPVLFLILPASSRPRHPAIVWIVFAAVAGALAAALLATPSARSALGAFMTTHLAPTLGGDRGAGPRGSDFLRHLALGIWLRMAVVVGLVWLFRRRERVEEFMGRPAAFFFAATFASSLPILISPVLAGHYFFPSVPFSALAFGTLALPAVASFRSEPGSLSWRAPAWIAVGLLSTAVVVLSTHGSLEVRNASLIRDLDAVASVAPVGQTIGACPGSSDDWGLVNYWQRFYRVSLRTDGAPANGWFLVASERCAVPSGCGPVAATTEFSLLRCDKP